MTQQNQQNYDRGITQAELDRFNEALRALVPEGATDKDELSLNDRNWVCYRIYNMDGRPLNDVIVPFPKFVGGGTITFFPIITPALHNIPSYAERAWNIHSEGDACLGDSYWPLARAVKECDPLSALEIVEQYFKKPKTLNGKTWLYHPIRPVGSTCRKCNAPIAPSDFSEYRASWCVRCSGMYCNACADRCGTYTKRGAVSCPNCVPCSYCAGYCTPRLKEHLDKKKGRTNV